MAPTSVMRARMVSMYSVTRGQLIPALLRKRSVFEVSKRSLSSK